MNKTSRYAIWGLWVFAFIVVVAFMTIYASQTTQPVLLYSGVAITLILSLILLLFVLSSNKHCKKTLQELDYMKQREQARLQEEQESSEQVADEHAEEFKMDEILMRIVPSAEVTFENAQQYSEKILQHIAKELNIVQGLVFLYDKTDQLFHVTGEYAYFSEEQPRSFPLGETLSGQVAKNQQLLNVKDMPEGYITILSGLGKGNPRHLLIAPIISKGESIGVIELASFTPFGKNEEQLIEKVTGSIVNNLNELRK